MGLTYYATNEGVEGFDVNSCGADILGFLHRKTGASLYRSKKPGPFRINYVLDAEECLANAVILEAVSSSDLVVIIKDKEIAYAWGDSPDKFPKFVKEWVEFLKVCGGYDTDPE